MRDDPKVKVAVISAHEGAATWKKVCRYIEDTTRFQLCSFHEYDDDCYRAARTRVERLWLRVKTFVIFPLRFLVHARRIASESAVIVVATSPFFMPMLVSWVIDRRRIRIVALMYDIYPEALVAKGILRRNGVVEKFLRRRLDRALREIDAVVFISEQHKSFVEKQVSLPSLVKVIPVSAHSEPFVDHVPAMVGGPVEILYCGTLGLLHDFSTFVRWFTAYHNHGAIAFSFYTSGAAKRAFENDIQTLIKRVKPETRILLGGALSETDWVTAMKRAQVGLVFQDTGAGSVIFPSKTASILASGQAVLAIADLESEIAHLILENDCGWVVEPGNTNGLERCIESLAQKEVLLGKRIKAFNVGHSVFGELAVAERWAGFLEAVVGAKAS